MPLFQEMVRLMTQKKFPVDFKCRYNFRKFPYPSSNNVHFKMVIYIYNDSGFRRYQKEMRYVLCEFKVDMLVLYWKALLVFFLKLE